MKTQRVLYTAIALIGLLAIGAFPAWGLPVYPDAIPNGNVNTCDNCHIGGGGGPGTSFRADFIDNGFTWTLDLAVLDSDGDGFTNGDELLDPDGLWAQGMDDPGSPSDVTLPGDETNHPATGARFDVSTQTLSPGATFWVNLVLNNAEAAKTGVPVVVALEMGGQYWFWPSWSYYDGVSGFDFQLQNSLPRGATRLTVLPSLTWPDTGGSSGSFRLLGAMLTPDMTGIDGGLATVDFTFGP